MGPRRTRMQRCSYSTILANYISDTYHRPAATKHPGVCRLHSASPSFASPILILLPGLTGQTIALHLPSNKPQEAADCSLCDEIWNVARGNWAGWTRVSNFTRILWHLSLEENMGGSAYHPVIMHIKLWLAMRSLILNFPPRGKANKWPPVRLELLTRNRFWRSKTSRRL